ncbi:hypothetical protein SAMN04487995_3908 [Dyadobacter koreensis]|uniref:FecR family protein n=1 Tax=Dyadobacter koreensis TaxID=408657 RepID=A0A1H6XSM1_9BACT|nr:hypothetical protein [Dyadobacter koreensis]SEJ27565.1 hypothetical protein SAMN04487995_3908 [Dyadobacter koreensis]
MIKIFSIFCILICIYTNLNAQNTDKTIRVKNGSDIRKTVPMRDRYLYEEFKEGKVFFRNGNISKSPLNYSLFHREIQFISPAKDTLLLGDNDFISKIIIQSDTFYFDRSHGHIQKIGNYGKIKLGKQQMLLIMGNEKYAGYNEYSGTAAVSSFSNFSNRNGELQQLQSNDKLILRRKSDYYLIDQNLRFALPNRANFLKLFPEKRKDITAYLKENETDFLKETDLVKLLEFCQSL